jgi:hypothetical protein
MHAFLHPQPACCMPCPYHPPLLDHCKYTWGSVKFTKLLIMQYSILLSLHLSSVQIFF